VKSFDQTFFSDRGFLSGATLQRVPCAGESRRGQRYLLLQLQAGDGDRLASG
jgi:hypothetical protein